MNYDFGKVLNVPVMEYIFKKGTCYFGMCFTLPESLDHGKENKTWIIPGCHLDHYGNVLSKKDILSGKEFDAFPPKDVIEKHIVSCIQCCFGVLSDKLIIVCFNEFNGKIGFALVENKKWYPVFSMIGE